MRRIAFSIALVALALPFVAAAPAQAQATRTWVSGVGDDVNPCSRTAPCKTFAGAISKTALGGEINCLDPGGFGGVTITKSISIDCHEVFASVLVAGTNGITIAFDSFGAGDVTKTVRLRNINVQGLNGTASPGLNGIQISGGTTITGGTVSIEDCLITGFSQNGIRDQRTGGGRLTITNTIARFNSITGILVNPASGATRINAALDNVIAEANGTGITAANGVGMSIKRSAVSNNTLNGLDAEGATTTMVVDNSLMSNNGSSGLFTAVSGTLRVSNSDIANNTTSAASGAWTSFGNNRITGAPGTPPTAAGGPTSNLGQQ
jgi:hypothetical protein